MVKVRWKLCKGKKFRPRGYGVLGLSWWCSDWADGSSISPNLKSVQKYTIYTTNGDQILSYHIVPFPSQHPHPSLLDNSLSFNWHHHGNINCRCLWPVFNLARSTKSQRYKWPRYAIWWTPRTTCHSLISPQTCDLFEEAAAPSVNTRMGTQQQSKSQRVNVAFSFCHAC